MVTVFRVFFSKKPFLYALIVSLIATSVIVYNGGRAIAASPSGADSTTYDVPIIEPTSLQVYTIYGELCLPNGNIPKTVHFYFTVSLMERITGVSHTNLRHTPSKYATKAGYATFNIDRIGIGKSSHPPSFLVSLDTNANITDQIIKKLRAGEIGSTAFNYVILVGHSYGTATAWLTAADYGSADAVIGTGWATSIQSDPLVKFFSGFYPAILDPKFTPAGYDLGYNTPLPGERTNEALYYLPNADPKVIELDFQSSACFKAAVIPDAGHDLNLQMNAPTTFKKILEFADLAIGPDGNNAGVYSSQCLN
jgi:hypothetical protein